MQTYGPQRSVANRGYPSSRKGLAMWAIIAGCIALVAALITAILCLALGLGFSSDGVSTPRAVDTPANGFTQLHLCLATDGLQHALPLTSSVWCLVQLTWSVQAPH